MGESSNVKESLLHAFGTKEVKSAVKKAVAEALTEQISEFSKVSFVERQKVVQRNAFYNTEKLLYGYSALENHLSNEKEYLEMALKHSSGSMIKYQKNKVERPDEEQLLADRKRSYERSLHDYERLKKALESMEDRKGYEIIRMKYLSGEDFTYEDIADILAGTDGFSENLNEKTVRRYKNKLVSEIALLLFGTDAI